MQKLPLAASGHLDNNFNLTQREEIEKIFLFPGAPQSFAGRLGTWAGQAEEL